MRAIVTTGLDILGLLLLAAGLVAGLLPLIGWIALAPGGLIVLAGSQLAARLAAPPQKPRPEGEFS